MVCGVWEDNLDGNGSLHRRGVVKRWGRGIDGCVNEVGGEFLRMREVAREKMRYVSTRVYL